jgi:energy-converting hydrogenase Eha subunit C
VINKSKLGELQMIRKTLITSIIFLALGTIGRIYAADYTYVNANNMLRDTAWLPISTLMFLVGMLLLPVSAGRYGVNLLQSR